MQVSRQWKSRFTTVGLVCGLMLSGMSPPFAALAASAAVIPASPDTTAFASPVTPAFSVSDDGPDSLLLSWNALQAAPLSEPVKQSHDELASALSTLPLINVNGVQLPARLVAVQLLDSGELTNASLNSTTAEASAGALPAFVQLNQLDSQPLESLLNVATTEVDQAASLLSASGQADLQAKLGQLPSSPVLIVRQAILRGHTIVVVALSPVFVQNGAIQVATHIQAQLANVRAFSPQRVAELMDAPMVQPATGPGTPQTVAPQAQTAQAVWRLIVSQAGIQRVTGQMLADVGMNLASVAPNTLHVRWQGADVAVDTRGFEDGVFNPADEIRFYAPEPGDRWNSTDVYTLGTEQTPAPRMATRPIQAAGASLPLTLRNTAVQRGQWHNNARYDSLWGGLDNNHWFASQLITPTQGHSTNSIRIELPASLPLASGPVSLTLYGTTALSMPHAFTARMGSVVAQSPAGGSFQGARNWAHTLSLSDNQPALDLQLVSPVADEYLLDFLTYERPVQLSFGGQSGHFWGVAGAWAYQLEGVPAQATIYDLTDVAAPVVLTKLENGQIYDSVAGPRHYWVSGGSTLVTPTISPDSGARITDNERWSGISQIYIVPRALRSQLTPLLTHRQSQNLVVQAVEIESIYTTWSSGQISPTAIRQFVRYMAEQNPALRAITLVGDGSNDPRNFLGQNNPTLIPPYLAEVDPWLGETACDTCYAQLNGDDALSDWLPDVMIGRLPVKNAAELTQMVNKIIAYENAPVGVWNWRSGHLADNYQEANGQPDSAGNFPAYQDAAVNLQPPNIDVRRAYFDPYLPSANTPWREKDPVRAHQNTLALFNAGAAVINFQGHGYYDQLGQTASITGSTVNYLLQSKDVAQLTNGSKLPMVLEMACWTGAFHQSLNGAATIDELLVLAPNGGAIATWGSTGWGVAYQHEYLQKGAYAALWATPQMDATVGDVAQQGLMTLFSEAACCMDALRTYALLGDPMTVLHALIPTRTMLPATLNQ